MSEIKVNKLSPRSGTAVTLGDSGDTFTIPSGATLAIAGSVTGFTSAGIDDNATSVAITIDSSERVGIGNTSPAFNLDVNSGTSDDVLRLQSTDNTVNFDIKDSTSNTRLAHSQGSFSINVDRDNQVASSNLAFKIDNTEEMRLTSTGLGIGTSNPSQKLEVNGNIKTSTTGSVTNGTLKGIGGTPVDIDRFELGAGFLNLDRDFASEVNQIQFGKSGTLAAAFATGQDYLVIKTNGNNERMRILSDGKVGIGTSTPNCVLDVNGGSANGNVFKTTTSGDNNYLAIDNTSTGGQEWVLNSSGNGSGNGGGAFAIQGPDSNTPRLLINSSGNVGIGTTAPQNTLHVLKSAISGASYRTNAPLIIENNSNTEIQILSANSSDGQLRFGDADANFRGAITYSHSDDSFTIATNGASQVKIHSNGVMSAADGIALGVGTANTASNVLDDYEEGTWTPGLTVANAGTSGTYTKIGNYVFARFKVNVNASGNDVNITGLPFTSTGATTGEQIGGSRETQTTGKFFFIRVSNNSTSAAIIRYDANVSFTSSQTFEGQAIYLTT